MRRNVFCLLMARGCVCYTVDSGQAATMGLDLRPGGGVTRAESLYTSVQKQIPSFGKKNSPSIFAFRTFLIQ